MSTHVTGFAPPDEQWAKMKAIWDACMSADILVPDAVEEFFGSEDPDPLGVEVELTLREWRDGEREGYELDVASLPPQVKTIRFYNSW